MDIKLRDKFIDLWKKYFDDAELPMVFYYTDDEEINENKTSTKFHCLIRDLIKVRTGKSIRFSVDSINCPGGRRYSGFSNTISEDFEYFLSYGIPGKIEGERYKKSPEMVREYMKRRSEFIAPKKYIVFKRWDQLNKQDDPAVVIFFAKPDVLAGLITLANFDEVEQSIKAPFGSGCMSIISFPYAETKKEMPHSIIGMFDPSARPYVQSDRISFAIPMNKFTNMINNMQESFLITSTWETIRKRITNI